MAKYIIIKKNKTTPCENGFGHNEQPNCSLYNANIQIFNNQLNTF